VTIYDGIKIHRTNCPNAQQMLTKYPYRTINAKWTRSDGSTSFQTVIKISGIDEVGMVNRISDVVSNDPKVTMRSISIESGDGMFEGVIKVFVTDIKHLEGLLRRFQKIKGVLRAVRFDETSSDG
jgi:GTP pyrophosphokinase